jgi:protein tyrosine/serine phosphatase
LVALCGCGLGALDNSAPLTVFDNFCVIEEGRAYRSAQMDASSLRLVTKEYGIKTVINLRGDNTGKPWYDNEKAVCAELDVAHVDVRMSASHLPPRETLLKLHDTLVSAEEPILIHCQAGADRTGAVSALWRMVVNDEPRAAAMRELSIAYGHFVARHPEMDQLVMLFEPSREWIVNEYTP